MSAIYGVVDLTSTLDTSNIINKFSEAYSGLKIDKFSKETIPGASFGCGIQYFTEEAQHEILPIYDKTNNILFTADCYLSNRDRLLEELGGPNSALPRNTPDGNLIYLSYLKWGKLCVEHLRGLFSFAVYKIDQREVTLFTDHFSSRCLFFHLREGVLYFSTLFFPLLSSSALKYELNEKWLVDTLSLRSPVMMIEPRYTAIENVLKVECGTYVTINREWFTYTRYYNPYKDIRINKKITDSEVSDTLHKTLKDSVTGLLRCSGNTGIKISSGLDSTSIAGFAAPILEKEGKKLYGYTSVPLKDSEYISNKYQIADETEGVISFCRQFPNIIPHFEDCADKNILTELNSIIDYWELPCKSQQNAVWTTELARDAYEDGCRIMLSGSTGNCTLSAGSFDTLLYDNFVKFRIISAYRSIVKYAHRIHIPGKKIIRIFVKGQLNHIYKIITRSAADCYAHILTSKKKGEDFELTKRFTKKIYNRNPVNSNKQMHKSIYLPEAYAQIGEIETKRSLKYGVLDIDPLRNVEFINFLNSLPLKYYVNEEYERRLVREFLSDVIPDNIRLNTITRGVQSADNAYRISQSMPMYLDNIEAILLSEQNKEFFDRKKTSELIKSIKEGNVIENEFDLRLMIDSYSFAIFLNKLRPYTK